MMPLNPCIPSWRASLPGWLARRASKRLSRQRYVPMSPGRKLPSGRVELCLGAAIAAEAIAAVRGRPEAAEFVAKLVRQPASQPIVEAFRRAGFSEELAASMIKLNDSLPCDRRKRTLVY